MLGWGPASPRPKWSVLGHREPSPHLTPSSPPQLWMMPAFGIHPEFENGLEQEFYGYRTWFTIVNFGLPLGVFYRMHSVGGLVEVYLEA